MPIKGILETFKKKTRNIFLKMATYFSHMAKHPRRQSNHSLTINIPYQRKIIGSPTKESWLEMDVGNARPASLESAILNEHWNEEIASIQEATAAISIQAIKKEREKSIAKSLSIPRWKDGKNIHPSKERLTFNCKLFSVSYSSCLSATLQTKLKPEYLP